MASIVIFDGVCNLCNGFVRWIIRHDPEGRFRFAPLQSEAGRALLESHGLGAFARETVVLVRGARTFAMSDAALEIARGMGFPFALLYASIVVPRALRDAVYGLVARNRYRWFGRRDTCMMPSPELRPRFLDAP